MHRSVLAGIVLLALLLRVSGLGNQPVGFTPDEASFGYDAYSLLQTGRDQWGTRWPLSFRSFGDFKLPLYTYLVMPSVAIFGLNEFSVRLPNAILGALAVLATYALVLQVWKRKDVALLSALFLALSPWHIPLSRGAFEANLTTFLLPAGLYFFFKGVKQPKFLYLAAILFGINLFSYHSARLLTLPLVAFLIWQQKKEILNSKNIFAGVILFVFATLAAFTMLGGGGARAATSGIFNPTGGWDGVAKERYQAVLTGEDDSIARIFHNKALYFGKVMFGNYFQYFSPQFLLTQGPAEGTYGMVPGMGVLAVYEFAGVLLFIVFVRKKFDINTKWLIFWLLLSPIAASLAKGPGYAANRAAFMMPAIQIASAIGGATIFLKYKKFFYVSLGVCFVFFLQGYIVSQKAIHAKAMIYGAREVVSAISSISIEFDEIIISKKISEPQIYFAFFLHLDPKIVQQESRDWLRYEKEGLSWVDQLGTYKLGKYTFRSIQASDLQKPNILLVGEPSDFPEKITPDLVIRYPNQSPAYYLIVTQKAFASR